MPIESKNLKRGWCHQMKKVKYRKTLIWSPENKNILAFLDVPATSCGSTVNVFAQRTQSQRRTHLQKCRPYTKRQNNVTKI